MKIFITGESIEMKMEQRITETCNDMVVISFLVPNDKVNEVVEYLEKLYDVNVDEGIDDKFKSVRLKWEMK